MEHNVMSSSFSGICKVAYGVVEEQGTYGLVPEHDAVPGDQLVLPGFLESDKHCIATQAHDSYISIINASTCANRSRDAVIDGYLTFTQKTSYAGSYMY